MSLSDDLQAIGRVSGVADLALVDFVSRGLAALPADATAQDIAKWVGELRPQASHLFIQPVVTDSTAQERERILALHPPERMTQARLQVPAAQKQRLQPQSHADTAAFKGMSVADFEKLPPNKRSDYARELAAQQGKG